MKECPDMKPDRSNQLVSLLAEARQRSGLSVRDLAERSGIPKSTLLRIEMGEVANPKPGVLDALATALDLDPSDVHAAAGYTKPTDLPSFTPYLRRKYGDLPAAATREIESSFARIAEKYGYDPAGPAPGEDEH